MLGKTPIRADNLASGLCVLYYQSLRLLILPHRWKNYISCPHYHSEYSLCCVISTTLACEVTKGCKFSNIKGLDKGIFVELQKGYEEE
jgi:hypothetical protein